MTKKHLITRPQEEAEVFAAKLAENGVEAMICSLTTIIYQNQKIPTNYAQAFIATSANALKKIENIEFIKPIYVIGDKTAQIAKEKGFKLIKTAKGNSDTLIELIKAECQPKQGKLLYLSGNPSSRDLSVALPEYEIEVLELYYAKPINNLPSLAKTAIIEGKIGSVSFFSVRAAEIFCQLCPKNIASGITAFCLSKSISQELICHNFLAIKTAPTAEKMLKLLKQGK